MCRAIRGGLGLISWSVHVDDLPGLKSHQLLQLVLPSRTQLSSSVILLQVLSALLSRHDQAHLFIAYAARKRFYDGGFCPSFSFPLHVS